MSIAEAIFDPDKRKAFSQRESGRSGKNPGNSADVSQTVLPVRWPDAVDAFQSLPDSPRAP